MAKKEHEETAPEGFVVPKGYRLVPEYKSARMQLLVQPAVKDTLVKEAKSQGLSLNELANRIFKDYLGEGD